MVEEVNCSAPSLPSSIRKHISDNEDGGDEDHGSTSDGSWSHGSSWDGPASVHSSGGDSVPSVPEGD